ncbi:putative DNA endonuclease [Clostridium phage vB_CtyS-FA67]|nr:putative DNA endonuclease [Clostridium phage vB_CtyS-FA67]WMU08162.1 putative DNA endonuclease [Clostridium phage vB_CtyS-FA70]
MLKKLIVNGKESNNYVADEDGNIFNVEGHIMKRHLTLNGYYRVKLCRDVKRGMYLVHRLIAETFIENIDKLPIVLHKNDIRTDCRVLNLKWGTNSENQLQRFKSNPPTRTSPVLQFTLDTGLLVKEYSSIIEAEDHTGVRGSNISKVCRGLRNMAGNYFWKYKQQPCVETIEKGE